MRKNDTRFRCELRVRDSERSKREIACDFFFHEYNIDWKFFKNSLSLYALDNNIFSEKQYCILWKKYARETDDSQIFCFRFFPSFFIFYFTKRANGRTQLKRFAKRFSRIQPFLCARHCDRCIRRVQRNAVSFLNQKGNGECQGDVKRDTMQITSNTDTYFVRGINCNCSFVAADRNAIALASNIAIKINVALFLLILKLTW